MDGARVDDADDLELTAELTRRLRQLEAFVPPEEMGELWIFPPLDEPHEAREFVLFTRMAGDDERAVYSARHRGAGTDGVPEPEARGEAQNGHPPPEGSGGDAPEQAVIEHGRAPAERIPGLVRDLLRRLGDDRAPAHVDIQGSRRRWDELVTRAAGSEPTGEGRAA
jgi:hypothetical protein